MSDKYENIVNTNWLKIFTSRANNNNNNNSATSGSSNTSNHNINNEDNQNANKIIEGDGPTIPPATISSFNTVSFTHTWLIKNFKSAYMHEYGQDYKICSKIFEGGGNSWQILILANERNGHKLAGVYLRLLKFSEGEELVTLNMTFEFRDGYGNVLDYFECDEKKEFSRVRSIWGNSTFIKDYIGHILNGDDLTLRLIAVKQFIYNLEEPIQATSKIMKFGVYDEHGQ